MRPGDRAYDLVGDVKTVGLVDAGDVSMATDLMPHGRAQPIASHVGSSTSGQIVPVKKNKQGKQQKKRRNQRAGEALRTADR